MRIRLTLFISASLAILFVTSCKKDSTAPGDSNGNEISDNLHMAFATPDWSRHIDCTLLDLNSFPLNDSTCVTGATSQSTKEAFSFSFPKDSSVIARAGNLKRYAIKNYQDNDAPFNFSQKLPITEGSSSYLVSEEGLSDNAYNEVASIKYVGSTTNEAIWQVKCRYKMMTKELNNTSNKKTVTGTFNLKIKTSRN